MATTSMSQDMQAMWASDFVTKSAYNYSYFSGSQINIYVGGKLLDEALFVSYELTQHKRPVYGYASRYWDALARGTVMVHGAIGLNYVDNRYLPLLIYDAVSQSVNAATLPAPATNATPQQLMQYLASLSGLNELSGAGMAAFQQVLQTQQQQVWSMGGADLTGMPRPDEFKPVNILLAYGSKQDNQTSVMKRLEQVSFMGESQTMEINGQPVLEVYRFIARKVVNILGSNTSAQPQDPTPPKAM
jgi:hypothetical protein